MDTQFVFQALIKDTLYVLAFPVSGVLAYFVNSAFGQMRREHLLWIVIVVFGGMMLLAFWSTLPFFQDYALYLQYGNDYVQRTDCQIVKARSGTTHGLLMAWQRLYCADGQEFITKYRRDYLRLGWRWAQERRVLRIYYLPRSRMVLKASPID